MLVYRIEHKKLHRGPFNIDTGTTVVRDLMHSTPGWWENHPSPSQDGLWVAIELEYKFAVCRFADLATWFPRNWRPSLRRLDFVCKVIDVPRSSVLFGRKGNQCAYDPFQAKCVGELPLA